MCSETILVNSIKSYKLCLKSRGKKTRIKKHIPNNLIFGVSNYHEISYNQKQNTPHHFSEIAVLAGPTDFPQGLATSHVLEA